jgi:hypothetical protein
MARGRKPGSPKTGGRKKGSLNKRTEQAKQLTAELATEVLKRKRLSPLEYMLRQITAPMPEAKTFEQKLALRQFRMNAAKDAAPYLHPKLATIEHKGNVDASITGNITMDVNDPSLLEAARRIAFVMAMGARAAKLQEKVVNSDD